MAGTDDIAVKMEQRLEGQSTRHWFHLPQSPRLTSLGSWRVAGAIG